MRRGRFIGLALGALSVAYAACSGDDDPPPQTTASDGGVEASGEASADAAPVVPKGARLLGLDLRLDDPKVYPNAQLARDAGASVANVRVSWDAIERPYDAGPDGGDAGGATEVYDPSLHVFGLVFEATGTKVVLAVDAVDVKGARLPPDLADAGLDDEALATRYERVVDYAFGQLVDVDVPILFVGGDLDYAFKGDAARYAAFAKLLERVATHVHTARPAVRVGAVVTSLGLEERQKELAPVWAAADVVGIDYVALDAQGLVRPAKTVAGDVDRAVAAVPAGKPVVFRQAGCTSADEVSSDTGNQAASVRALFEGWDRNSERVPVMVFRSLDDTPEDVAQAEADDRGRGADLTFVRALQGLGLRPKPALGVFRDESRARGF